MDSTSGQPLSPDRLSLYTLLVIRRLARYILMIALTLIVSSLIVFMLSEASPGDSSAYVLAEDASGSARRTYLDSTGAEGSMAQRYIMFLRAFIVGDWGFSASGFDIRETVLRSAGVTFSMALLSVSISLLISIPLSLLGARKGSVADRILSAFSLVLMSLPSFLVAMLLVLLFAMRFPLFPVAGLISGFPGYLKAIFLPSLTLALLHSSLYLRVFRRALSDGLDSQYSLFALSLGVKRRSLALSSAFRPALPVLSSLVAQSLASALGGAAVIETVFALPGLGALMVDAALSRDSVLAGTIMMLVSLAVSVVYFLFEGVMAIIDPRVRRSR